VARRRKVWYLYRFWDKHGRLLYIGQSSNPWLRRDQHADKFWWPRYLDGGTWRVDPQPYPTLAKVLAAEKRAIGTEKPLCNVEHNQHNPDRILPPPGWTPRPATTRPRAGRPPGRRRWKRRRIRRTVATSAWLLVAVGLLAAMANPTGGGGGIAAFGVVILFGAHKPRRRRR
jgi:hypothetical protein